jgi:predicted RNA binding protein YcfA (HicA-like mRNA interferase family)
MKTPRDLTGAELIKKLKGFDYEIVRQTGSHIIIRTQLNGEHTLPIPNHKPLKVGTLDGIVAQIAKHFEINKYELMQQLFSK